MCGRYVSVRSDADLARRVRRRSTPPTRLSAHEPDYNVAPTKPVRIVVNRPLRDADGTPAGRRPPGSCGSPRWGLVPSWAKDRKTQGADVQRPRRERRDDEPAFRRAYAKRRCLVPADGWYEWQAVGPGAQAADAT